jgi:hypothetical protein
LLFRLSGGLSTAVSLLFCFLDSLWWSFVISFAGACHGSKLAGALLDFDVGKNFEHELCRSLGKAVHDASSGGRFLLLATFRRYLFQLNEFSVVVAL